MVAKLARIRLFVAMSDVCLSKIVFVCRVGVGDVVGVKMLKYSTNKHFSNIILYLCRW